MRIDNELLSAYLDGELAPEEMQRVRLAIEGDELLAARLRRFRDVDRMVSGFAQGVDAEPLPFALRARLGLDARTGVTLDPAPTASGAGTESGVVAVRRWRVPVAAAAALLVALFAGLLARAPQEEASLEQLLRTGPVASASPLGRALDALPSDSVVLVGAGDGLRITPQLSFVSSREGVCREFRVDAGGRAGRGVACRRADAWNTLRAASVAPAAPEAGYQSAGEGSDAGYDAYVDALVDAGPLSAQEEAELLQRGWRTD